MSGETAPTGRIWTFDAEPGDEWTPDDEFVRVEDVPTALPSRDALVASIKAARADVPAGQRNPEAEVIADRIIADAGVTSIDRGPSSRCPKCAGLNGAHGSIHVRHPEGGGGTNLPCPRSEVSS